MPAWNWSSSTFWSQARSQPAISDPTWEALDALTTAKPRDHLFPSRRMNYLVDTSILTRLDEPGHPLQRQDLDATALVDMVLPPRFGR